MKILIKKEFAGYKPNSIIEIDETKPHNYTGVAYWLRRTEDGKIDGYCELLEFAGKKVVKTENVIQSDITVKEVTKKKNKYTVKE